MTKVFCDFCGMDITEHFGLKAAIPRVCNARYENGHVSYSIDSDDKIEIDICSTCAAKLWVGKLTEPIRIEDSEDYDDEEDEY